MPREELIKTDNTDITIRCYILGQSDSQWAGFFNQAFGQPKTAMIGALATAHRLSPCPRMYHSTVFKKMGIAHTFTQKLEKIKQTHTVQYIAVQPYSRFLLKLVVLMSYRL